MIGSVFETPIGKIAIGEQDGFIVYLGLPGQPLPADFEKGGGELIKEAGRQLEEYLQGRRTAFDLPLNPKGTEFMRDVWKALLDIPYGETVTYGEIAKKIGRPNACRAVGQANNRNPIPIVIPCHRVIGAGGALVGYGGGIPVKERLLALEGK